MAQSVDRVIRAARTLTVGLILGLLVFAGVAAIVKGTVANTGDPTLARLLLGVLAFSGVGCAAAYAVVYRSLLRGLEARAAELRQKSDPSDLIAEPYGRFAILGAALIEGPGFLAITVYMLTGDKLALTLGALAVILLAMHLPSQAALQRLAETVTRGW
jgi:hypothetical protein